MVSFGTKKLAQNGEGDRAKTVKRGGENLIFFTSNGDQEDDIGRGDDEEQVWWRMFAQNLNGNQGFSNGSFWRGRGSLEKK